MGMFDFNPNKQGYTYEDVQRRRMMAEALQQQLAGASPTTFGGGLNSVGTAIASVISGRKADQSEALRAVEGDNRFEAALSGVPQDNSQLAMALGGQAPQMFQSQAAAPESATPFTITPGIVSSLAKTESGGDWTALNSEGFGGRLQFGKARLADAARAGVISAGVDGAAFSKMSPEAQQRVEGWHFADIDRQAQARGLDKYVGQVVGGVPITQDSIRAMAHLGGIGGASKFLTSGGASNAADSNGTSLAKYARIHGGASGGEHVAFTGSTAPAYTPPTVNVSLLRAMQDPYLTPEQKQMLGGVYAQQQAMQITPYQQAQLQMAQQEMAMKMQPQPVKPVEINGQLVDPTTGQVMGDYRTPAAAGPEFRAATPEEAAGYGAAAGQVGPDGRFYPINPPSGMTVETGPDGQVRVVQGSGAGAGGAKPFTEGQSKDVIFATRARGALQAFEPYSEALTSRTERLAENVPLGLGRASQTPEFQMAQQAGDEFLQAILRKDTGAAITEGEQALYGKSYLPQPGDGPEALSYKKAARQRAIDALEAGMSPSQIIAQEAALSKGAAQPIASPPDAPGAMPDFNSMTEAQLDAYLGGG